MVIYKIVNNINNKVYVGQTTRPLSHRWTQHLRDVNKYDYPIYRAMQKYGREKFKIEKIDIANNVDELNKKEQYWINKLNSLTTENGYNVLSGGKNCRLPQEIKDKISRANKNRLYKSYISKEEKSKIAKENGSRALKNTDGLRKFHEENPNYSSDLMKEYMSNPEIRENLRKKAKHQFNTTEAKENMAKLKGGCLFEVRCKNTNNLLYKGYNQYECARKLKVSQRAVNKWVLKINNSRHYIINVIDK